MIKKQFLKSKPVCKVTFSIPADALVGAQEVKIAGDFSQWTAEAVPMKKAKDGSFKAIVELETGKEYQFRYLVDDNRWVNDTEADKYVPNNLTFEENSVVCL
jgi:1,4-alpha-glucan branching enzyme